MLCAPATSADVLSAALPFVSGTVPKVAAPSVNVTAPVGAPAPCGVTVAVNVTTRLKLDGLSEEKQRRCRRRRISGTDIKQDSNPADGKIGLAVAIEVAHGDSWASGPQDQR